jgi:hypothetical protein
MDRGDLYEEKSRINDEIFRISEPEAFALARKAALSSLALAYRMTRNAEVPETKVDLRQNFITPALAAICHEWFGIPDSLIANDQTANFVDPKGWSWDPAEARKPRCPGDYMATSRFCFYPDPVPRVRAYGKSQGQALRKAVGAYFDRVRAPGKPLKGLLTQAMANLQSNGRLVYATNDELARNVIGVMTGFLPPADGCMRFALYDWIEEKTLQRVQHSLLSAEPRPADLKAADAAAAAAAAGPGGAAGAAAARDSSLAYARANAGLRPLLERAMQKRPAPDLLWRTATRDHRLGDVEIAADERVFVGIVSALAEDEAAGITDVCPIFGGERGLPDSPLHACPAYKAAMGTMLGVLSALLESFRIEPLPASMLVTLSEPSPMMSRLIESDEIAAFAAALTGAAPAPSPSAPAVAPALAPAPRPDLPEGSPPAPSPNDRLFVQYVESGDVAGIPECAPVSQPPADVPVK